MITRCEESMTNLLLSDSDINNRRRVILREAKRTWEVGKKLGLSVRGDKEEVINEIRILEGQYREEDKGFERVIDKNVGRSHGLLTIWNKDEFKLSKEWSDDRLIVIEGKWVKEDLDVVLINVYALNIVSK
ncbi:hypothetical protein PVK06_034875 [Gossypium arboreum]|uniref:SAP domain-containing protein n=1 Tax=Gossypium arboreum TaxID=29729 RepID=A0ABR0NFD1_GOSAR|nr:hypothetical protein PVK06_034875 [Gossypium arboreum]